MTLCHGQNRFYFLAPPAGSRKHGYARKHHFCSLDVEPNLAENILNVRRSETDSRARWAPSAFQETGHDQADHQSQSRCQGIRPTAAAPLIVLGYDEHHKPQAAQFPAADADLVAKAARLMDLKVYEAATEDLAALAKKLPVGRLYSNGRGFVPSPSYARERLV